MAAADTPNHLRPQDWDELLLGQASEQASAHLDVCGQCRSISDRLSRDASPTASLLSSAAPLRWPWIALSFLFLAAAIGTERLVAAVLGSHVSAPASVEDHRVPENDERRAVLAPARPRVWHRPCMVVGRAHPRRHHDERSPPAHRSHRARFRAASVPALLSCDPQQAPDDVSRMRFRAPAGEGLVTTHPDARSSRQRLRSLP